MRREWWEGKRIAYLDIETSDLKADFGMILTWCLKLKGKNKILSSVITKKEIFNYDFDKRVVKELLDALNDVDIVVTYNGTNFDIPYLRTRALLWGFAFPTYGTLSHWDLYFRVKSQFRTYRKSLAVVTNFLGIAGKTPVEPRIWYLAKYGNPRALNSVLEHNKADVIILEKLHDRIGDFSKWIKRSI